jgi:hypothetical protein
MSREAVNPVARLYRLTAVVGLLGTIGFVIAMGPGSGMAFLLGALGSLGNLWLFGWLSSAIAPGERSQKPWQAGAFIGRYLVLIAFGYVIVNALGVNPSAVVLGLLASTAAVALSLTIELADNLLRGRRAR